MTGMHKIFAGNSFPSTASNQSEMSKKKHYQESQKSKYMAIVCNSNIAIDSQFSHLAKGCLVHIIIVRLLGELHTGLDATHKGSFGSAYNAGNSATEGL